MRLIVIVALCLVSQVATSQSPGLPPVRVAGLLPVGADSFTRCDLRVARMSWGVVIRSVDTVREPKEANGVSASLCG